MKKQKRVVGVDILRGWAILFMVIYHLAYYLNYLHLMDIDLKKDIFWVAFHLLIVNLFISLVGVSLKLAHYHQINWGAVKKRVLILSISSLLVTIASYIQFPHKWVYFGILHFILVASILALPFLKYRYISLFLAILIFVGSAFHLLDTHWIFHLVYKPLHLPRRHTMDLIRLFPWFGVVLLGVSFVGFGLHQKLLNHAVFTHENIVNRLLIKMGRYALIIYLVHQPILFGVCLLLAKVLN